MRVVFVPAFNTFKDVWWMILVCVITRWCNDIGAPESASIPTWLKIILRSFNEDLNYLLCWSVNYMNSHYLSLFSEN